MRKFKLLIVILLLVSCSNANNEWIYLFDGETTNGWRAYNGKEIPKKWAAVDGELTFNTDLKLLARILVSPKERSQLGGQKYGRRPKPRQGFRAGRS